MQNTIKPSPKDFNLMVLGQIISIFGSALLRFALSLYVLDLTGKADLFAALFAISSIPILLSPIGGAVADRFNRRNLMVIFDFTSSAIVLALILFMLGDNHSVVFIGVVMFLIGIVNALYTPAVTASIPLLVEESKLESANGVVQAVQSLSGIVAPVLGGILYGVFGIHVLIVLSCIAFFLSAVMEIFIKIPFVKRPHEGHIVATITQDMKEGFAYVVKQPFIFKAMILATLLNLILSPLFLVGAPIILRVTMQSSETMYGFGMGILQFSSILGAFAVGYFSKRMEMRTVYRWILSISVLTIPAAVSTMPFVLNLGYYPAFILFMVPVIIISAALTIMSIFIIVKVQRHTPNENLGKVMAIVMAVAQCAAPLGQILYGVAFEAFSAAVYLPVFTVSLILLVMSGMARYVLRNEDNG